MPNARVPRDRAQVLADAAIRVLARDGMRGLTHRAVDAQAMLPPGSTSNRFRSRHDLVMGVVARLAERDLADLRDLAHKARAPEGGTIHPAQETSTGQTPGEITSDAIARLLTQWATTDIPRLHARLTLTVESLRDPAVRDALQQGREQIVAMVDSIRTQAKSHGRADPLGSATTEQAVAFYAAAQWARATHGTDLLAPCSTREEDAPGGSSSFSRG